MKKIINGKRYDTDSAKEIGHYDEDITNDLDYISESLYLKRTGEFFLAGSGGARTRYGGTTSDGWYCSGETIEPITDDSARKWVEKHCSAETYEQLFDVAGETDGSADIKALRQSTGLTQAAFAEKYEIPKRTLENWEAGSRVPPEYVIKLLRYRIEH